VSNGEFAPRLVDGGVEETQLEVGFDGDVLGEAVGGGGGGGFDEDILAVEAQAFVCDFGSGDFEGAEGFDGVYEELVCGRCYVSCAALYGADKAGDPSG
jgi:hypothetical protein